MLDLSVNKFNNSAKKDPNQTFDQNKTFRLHNSRTSTLRSPNPHQNPKL